MCIKRILVVDDEPSVTRNLKLNLESSGGYDVFAENHATNALTAARIFRPDLILLDISLPKLNGLNAARQIRKVAPKSTILFLSGESDPDVVRDALCAGGVGYVLKWEATRDLLTGIESVLLGRRFVSSSLWAFDVAS